MVMAMSCNYFLSEQVDVFLFLCLLQSPSIKILALIVHVGNTALVHPTHFEELLNADEPVDESQEGGEEAGGEEDDGHGHDELLLVHLPDQFLFGKHRNGGVPEDLDGGDAEQPDEVDDEGAAEEER